MLKSIRNRSKEPRHFELGTLKHPCVVIPVKKALSQLASSNISAWPRQRKTIIVYNIAPRMSDRREGFHHHYATLA
jgi:hypothetical protein